MPRAKKNEKSNQPDKKWLKERLKEVGFDYSDVARELPAELYIVKRMIAGTRRIQLDEVISWSRILQVPFLTVIEKFGFELPDQSVPVIGHVLANGRVSEIAEGQLERRPVPAELAEDVKALVVTAPESGLAMWNGWTLYYTPTEGLDSDAFGRLSLVQLGDHRTAIVGYLDKAATLGSVRVVIFGGREIIDSKQLISATPIRWIRL